MAYPDRVRRLVLHGAVGIGPRRRPRSGGHSGPFADCGSRIPHFGRLKHFGPLVRNTAKEGFKEYMATESGGGGAPLRYWWQLLCAQPLGNDTSVNICLTPIATDERTSMYGRRPVAEEGEARLANLARTRPAFVYGESELVVQWRRPTRFIDALPGASLGHLYRARPTTEYLDQYRRYHAVLEEVLGREDAGRGVVREKLNRVKQRERSSTEKFTVITRGRGARGAKLGFSLKHDGDDGGGGGEGTRPVAWIAYWPHVSDFGEWPSPRRSERMAIPL